MTKLTLTADEAIDLLPAGETVHNFKQAGMTLLGCDYSREDAETVIRNAVQREVGGERCRAMKHALVVWHEDKDFSFFETDPDKIDALDPPDPA